LSKARTKPPFPGRSPRQRQRGASAVLVAMVLFALLSALGAALDVGRLYFAQRDLQRLANLAALDGARAIGGCRGPVEDPQAVAEAAVRNSVQANGGNVAILDHALSAVELGEITSAGGLRDFAATAPADAVAVRVTLVDPAPPRLLPLFTTGTGNLRVRAAAFSAPTASISVGSSLASLDAADSPLLNATLCGLLGISPCTLALDAVSYKGLANVQVSLQDLVDTGVVAGGVEDFLRTEISAPVFLEALGEALSDSDPALAALVDSIAAVADPGRTVLPGALFPVEAGLETLTASLPVNAATLLGAIALAAAEGAPVDLAVPVSLPGVASASAQLRVIQPPAVARGRPGIGSDGEPRVRAHTGQALLQLDIDLEPITVNLPPLASITLDADLHLYLTLAQATATLTELTCASPAQPFHTATVAVDTDIATLGLGVFDNLGGPNPQPVASPPLVDTTVTILTLPPIGLRVDATAGPVDVGTALSQVREFEGPFVPQIDTPSADNRWRVGTPVGEVLGTALEDLSASLDLDVTLDVPTVGILLQPLLNTVVSLLTSLVAPALAAVVEPLLVLLDDTLLNPLLEILGLEPGAADVTVEAVHISLPDPQFGGDRPHVELVTH
jgi:uncharacterized membrane protein